MASGLPIRLEAILPERMNMNVLKTNLRNVVRNEVKEHRKLFEEVSKTWKEKDKPKWLVRTSVTPTSISGFCTTNSKPFVYLELGTKTRKRRMQKGYGKRTRPRYLGSFVGAREADGWFINPVPGISPGEWRDTVAHLRKPEFEMNVRKAMGLWSLVLFRTGKGITVK